VADRDKTAGIAEPSNHSLELKILTDCPRVIRIFPNIDAAVGMFSRSLFVWFVGHQISSVDSVHVI
jgi:hypothetical protein